MAAGAPHLVFADLTSCAGMNVYLKQEITCFLLSIFFFPSQVCINMPKQDAELAQTDLFKPGNTST